MKKSDISKLVVSGIKDVFEYCLAKDTTGSSTLNHSVFIVKHSGLSYYYVGDNRYTADCNNIIFMPAGTSYSMSVEKSGQCTVIEFDTINTESEFAACEYFTGGESDIINTAKNILHYWTLRGPAFQSKCISEIYIMITQISTLDSYENSLAGKYGMIHRSVKYIEANYNKQDLYTPELAKMSGMGETYYRNIFISVFSVPPAKYIQQYRVDKAKQFLVRGNMSVEEIAVSVGFANSSYFCKVFKLLTDLTPSEFAEKGKHLG